MPLVATQEGTSLLWQWILGILPPSLPIVHLIGSAFTPEHVSTMADYTAVELVVDGYAPIILTAPAANWALAPIPAGTQATHVQISWTFTGSCVVYGYWLSDNSDATALWGETFASPYPFSVGGGFFPLSLPFTLTSQP